ncbi:CHASE2 domain-containing protein [Reichenbachiella sp. MALMAid0571]|uniref:CHASE2 domain-containing protein n=1 Tax=Reichenbachiella sp. MALMAid0571 TaxID=3143939 RepID=UPI0032DF27AC
MFKKFWLDTILGTIFILLLMLGFSRLTYFKIFDVLDPIGDAFADMETTDIVFSQIRQAPTAEEDIVLVNIGTENRAGIAYMISIINQFNPKVVGVDTFFKNPKDSIGDQLLEEAFASVENLILVSKLENTDEDDQFDSLGLSHSRFNQHAQTAFANFITGASTQEDLKNCRTFAPREMVNGKMEYALSVKLAMEFAPEKAEKFLKRGNDVEIINYKGNVFDYGATKFGTTYFALDVQDVYNQNFVPDLIEGKIVIFCFLGNYLGDRQALEDKYFTPLNAKYTGKAHADMFGGVVHANALSMILNENYIDSMSDNWSYFWAFFLLYLNVTAFCYIYKVVPKWYDGLTKLIQLLEALALFSMVVYVFNFYDYKLEFNLAIIAILLSGDLLEIYFGVIKNLFTKEGRRELTKLKKL